MDDAKDLEAFRLPLESPAKVRPASAANVSAAASTESRTTSKKACERIPRQQGAFIRGPISLAWIDRVLMIPGVTALRVALALFYQSGLEKSLAIRFTHKLMKLFRVDPRSASRALERMQARGLVRVKHRPGRCREVEILTPQPGETSVTFD